MSAIKNILLPTDFSESAHNVFDYTQWLAKKHHAKIDLVHVIPKISYLEISEEVMGNPFKIQSKYAELREKLTGKLVDQLHSKFEEENRGKVYVNDGIRVAQGVINHSEDKKYDLIVIGSRGKGKSIFRRGSVTMRLIRLSTTPVLSFNKKIDAGIQNVLVPTDGSKLSFEALDTALRFAALCGASLELYSVLEFDFDRITLMGGDPKLSEYAAMGQKKEILENLQNHIDQSEDFKFADEPNLKGATILMGDQKIELKITMEFDISAHSSIVDYADENAQMVVMTTHGRTGLAKILLGSVAEKVIRHVKTPILTIKPKQISSKA